MLIVGYGEFRREKDSARKARDAQLHSALFMPGGLKDGTELGYYTQDTVLHLTLFRMHVPHLLCFWSKIPF